MKYLIKMKNSSVRIMHLLDGSIESELEKHHDSSDVEYYREVSEEDIPQSREFRDAWTDADESSKINIDMIRAKDITIENVRIERDEAFAKTDAEFMAALSLNDETKLELVRIRQQELRDVTEPLKAIVVSGVDDVVKLNELRSLKDEALAKIKK